jgi:DNA repair protein RadA/Sms
MRLQEPAGDLAVAGALASSVFDRPLPADAIFLGEVGLGGEIRAVSQADRRVAEAANMGMQRVYLAERGMPKRVARGEVELVGIRTIQDLLRRLFA